MGLRFPTAVTIRESVGAAVGALRDELMYFCECVRNGRQPEVITPREARNAVRVVRALVESGICERDIEINDWD